MRVSQVEDHLLHPQTQSDRHWRVLVREEGPLREPRAASVARARAHVPPPLVEMVQQLSPSRQMLTGRLHLLCPINILHSWCWWWVWRVGRMRSVCACARYRAKLPSKRNPVCVFYT